MSAHDTVSEAGSSRRSGDAFGPHTSLKQDALLRLEYISEREAKALLNLIRLGLLLSIGLLVWTLVVKWDPRYTNEVLATHNEIPMVNTVVASICTALLLGTSTYFFWRVAATLCARKRWSRRRLRGTQLAAAELMIQLLNASFYLVPNVYLLVHECHWFDDIVHWSGLIRWTCWNTLFLLSVVQVDNLLPVRSSWFKPKSVARLGDGSGQPAQSSEDDLLAGGAKAAPQVSADSNDASGKALDAVERGAAELRPKLTGTDATQPDRPRGAQAPQSRATDSNGAPFVSGKPDSDADLRGDIAKINMDRSWLVHWPKVVLLWVPMQTVLLLLFLLITNVWTPPGAGGDPNLTLADALVFYEFFTCGDTELSCSISNTIKILTTLLTVISTTILMGFALLYDVVYMLMVWRVLWGLRQFDYSKYRIGNLIARLQLRIRFLAFGFFATSIVCLWFLRLGTCTSYMETWLGMAPLQFMQTTLVCVSAMFFMPKDPCDQDVKLRVFLQEFAWTEADHVVKLRKRGIPDEPMFCFETALKCLYWSNCVYYYPKETPTSNLDSAMKLYSLQHHELFREKSRDTKALVAWGNGVVMVAFRGTASLANLLSDLKFWRAPHPPARGQYWLGSQPLVHKGFLQTWTAGGFNERLVAHISEVVRAQVEAGRSPVNIYVTGHSLGGALASLAALEIQRALSTTYNIHVRCYVFGAPRTGNHAFARECRQSIEMFQIINDQDAVAKAGKFFCLFKHGGHRVLIFKSGDILCRPSFIEASLLRLPASANSMPHHFLTAYKRAMAAIIRAQFREQKAIGGGREALRRLAAQSYVQQVLTSHIGLRAESISRMTSDGLDAGKGADAIQTVEDGQPSGSTTPSARGDEDIVGDELAEAVGEAEDKALMEVYDPDHVSTVGDVLTANCSDQYVPPLPSDAS